MTGPAKREALQGITRGLRLRCPNCGEGKLLAGYIKVASPCAHCGHVNAAYRADDGPAYVTIFLVGHLVFAPILFFPFVWQLPPELVLAMILPPILIAILLVLPRAKGAMIGLQWSQGLK